MRGLRRSQGAASAPETGEAPPAGDPEARRGVRPRRLRRTPLDSVRAHAAPASAPRRRAILAPESILTIATRLMGPARTDWAAAMHAELAALDDPRTRRRFALGCAWAALRTPRAAAAISLRVLAAIPLLATLIWALQLHHRTLRIESAALTLAVAALPPTLARANTSWRIRLLRTTALTLLAAEAILLLHGFDTSPDPADKTAAAPLVAAVLAAFAAGLAAATSRRAARMAREAVIGITAATAVTLFFLAPSLIAPPLPSTSGWAQLCVPTALAAAALAALRRHPTDPGRARSVVTAALTAAAFAALELTLAVQILLGFTASWVPAAGPRAIPLADQLLNNRAGVEDRYLVLLALGAVAALCLAGVARLPRAGAPALSNE